MMEGMKLSILVIQQSKCVYQDACLVFPTANAIKTSADDKIVGAGLFS
jgi:hypothetical protein